MFNLQVAQAMFKHLCSPAPPPAQAGSSTSNPQPSALDPQQLAATFAAQKKERASRVTEQQRQKMYVQLVSDMDELPPIFLRTPDCQIVPLIDPAEGS